MSPAPDAGHESVRDRLKPRAARWAEGKALRERVPFRALGQWDPLARTVGPIDQIVAAHEGRVRDLVTVRVARMSVSPYSFLRGAADVMASDISRLPATGIRPVVCGDAHLGNVGFYRSTEGDLVIDLNDFDEAHTGAWEWDLRRLTASIWVAGRENGRTEDECQDAVVSCVSAYRDEVRFLAYQPLLARNFNRLDVARLNETVTEKSLRGEIERTVSKARRNKSDRMLPKLTEVTEGSRRIVPDPPLLRRVTPERFAEVGAALDDYLTTLTPQWRRAVAGYHLTDVAHRVVGVGSVGLRSYIALLEGSDPEDVLFIQLKEARRSVLAPFVHGSEAWHEHQGHRVVEYQQDLQTVSDPLLGWTSVGGRDMYVRQWRNMKGTIDLQALSPQALSDYAEIVGHLLAKGHARTSGASMIAGYIGKSDQAALGFSAWARAYADQTEVDYEEFMTAARHGRFA